MTRLTPLVLSLVLIALGLRGASAQVAHFPLKTAEGLRLHNVNVVPAVLDGREGLRITLSEETLRRFKSMTVDQTDDVQARVGQYAVVEGLEFSDGVIEAEVAGAPSPDADPSSRGFVGIAFRLRNGAYQLFSLRLTNGRAEQQERRNHATQYASHPDWPWFRMRREAPERYEAYADLVPDVWTPIRIDVRGDRARLYLHGQEQPTLVVNDLKSDLRTGQIALWINAGTVAYFRNLTVTQPRRYPLESTTGLRFVNATAEPATLDGKKGLRVIEKVPASSPQSPQVQRTTGEALAVIEGLEFGDGVIEVEMAGEPAPGAPETARGFVGIAFRVQSDMQTFEQVYLRPTNGRAEDQERRNHSVQYSSHPDWPFFRTRKETPSRYEAYVDLVPGVWTKVRIEVRGAQARLYVHGQTQPTLIVNDLKMGSGARGAVALTPGVNSVAHFRNLTITPAPSGHPR
jgi:hypothetical protein